MREFLEPLLAWFAANKESYFFRGDRNPYRVWVSEVALQQTRLAAALPRLKKFLDTFPSVAALSEASEQQVVVSWAGLGYYNRARNLRRGAIYLRDNYHCEIPSDYHALLKIPSVGPYTAAAIASICFGKPVLAIDGNVKRVLARWFCWREDVTSLVFLRKVAEVEPLILAAASHPGELNEALMEFGQKVCSPRPICQECFLSTSCLAYSQGMSNILPMRQQARVREKLEWTVYLVKKDNHFLLQHNGEDFPFLKNMAILPSAVHYPETGKTVYSFCENFLTSAKELVKGNISHAIMHYKITATVIRADLKEDILPPQFEFVPQKAIHHYLNSSLMKKIMTAVL